MRSAISRPSIVLLVGISIGAPLQDWLRRRARLKTTTP